MGHVTPAAAFQGLRLSPTLTFTTLLCPCRPRSHSLARCVRYVLRDISFVRRKTQLKLSFPTAGTEDGLFQRVLRRNRLFFHFVKHRIHGIIGYIGRGSVAKYLKTKEYIYK